MNLFKHCFKLKFTWNRNNNIIAITPKPSMNGTSRVRQNDFLMVVHWTTSNQNLVVPTNFRLFQNLESIFRHLMKQSHFLPKYRGGPLPCLGNYEFPTLEWNCRTKFSYKLLFSYFFVRFASLRCRIFQKIYIFVRLSSGQPIIYIWLSRDNFGCPGQPDTH